MSVADRLIFDEEAGDALDLFGYERERSRATMVSRLKRLMYSTVVRW